MRYKNKFIYLNKEDNKIDSIYAIGDIHGKFEDCTYDLINTCKISNCAVIVCGDIGLGFFSVKETMKIFNKIERKLARKNIYLIFFRGNHDDPSWFEYKEDDFAENHPHIIIAEDFTIVDYKYAEDGSSKILLWGGGISIDRTMRTPGKSYWLDEAVKPLPDELMVNNEIEFVCSHSSPNFCMPQHDGIVKRFYEIDPSLESDIKKERETLADGAKILYKKNYTTFYAWIYGHYHDMHYSINMNEDMIKYCPGVRFIGLDMYRDFEYIDKFNKMYYNMFNRKCCNHIVKLK